MKELLVIVWAVLAILCGIWLRWAIKKYGRQLDPTTPIHILVFALSCSAISLLVNYLVEDEVYSIWVNRFVLFFIGIMQVWSLYRQSWVQRDKLDYAKDSIVPELAFTLFLSFLCSVCFVLSPRMLLFFKVGKGSPDLSLWDAPLFFLLPFLLLKLGDWASQIPYRMVENYWFTPLETINVENWPWRDLIRINFRVADSLQHEYRLFGSQSKPWIEVPRDAPLGRVFSLTMQERRKSPQLTTIQDVGNEYDGQPKFCWLFSIKVIWWRPSTWQRRPRYLNPDWTLAKNQILNSDVINARRIPADNSMLIANRPFSGKPDFDPEKTVFIQR